MTEEEGYALLERGDLIGAYNAFSAAQGSSRDPVQRARMAINQGALLVAMGKYSLAIQKLIEARALLAQAKQENAQLMAIACLNMSKAFIALNAVERAEGELRCAERLVGGDDPHLLYTRALIYFYRNDAGGLEGLPELPPPYGALVRLLRVRMGLEEAKASSKEYMEALREAIPSSGLREALGLV